MVHLSCSLFFDVPPLKPLRGLLLKQRSATFVWFHVKPGEADTLTYARSHANARSSRRRRRRHLSTEPTEASAPLNSLLTKRPARHARFLHLYREQKTAVHRAFTTQGERQPTHTHAHTRSRTHPHTRTYTHTQTALALVPLCPPRMPLVGMEGPAGLESSLYASFFSVNMSAFGIWHWTVIGLVLPVITSKRRHLLSFLCQISSTSATFQLFPVEQLHMPVNIMCAHFWWFLAHKRGQWTPQIVA